MRVSQCNQYIVNQINEEDIDDALQYYHFKLADLKISNTSRYISVLGLVANYKLIRAFRIFFHKNSVLLLVSPDPHVRGLAIEYVEYFDRTNELTQLRKEMINELHKNFDEWNRAKYPTYLMLLKSDSGQEILSKLHSACCIFPFNSRKRAFYKIHIMDLFTEYTIERIEKKNYTFKGAQRFLDLIKKELETK